MAEIINLNRVRKAKARDEKNRRAEANRVSFGRTKAEKLADKTAREAADKKLDGHKMEDET